jgi:hypothetical protein
MSTEEMLEIGLMEMSFGDRAIREPVTTTSWIASDPSAAGAAAKAIGAAAADAAVSAR